MPSRTTGHPLPGTVARVSRQRKLRSCVKAVAALQATWTVSEPSILAGTHVIISLSNVISVSTAKAEIFLHALRRAQAVHALAKDERRLKEDRESFRSRRREYAGFSRGDMLSGQGSNAAGSTSLRRSVRPSSLCCSL